jgi:hypothetical protein
VVSPPGAPPPFNSSTTATTELQRACSCSTAHTAVLLLLLVVVVVLLLLCERLERTQQRAVSRVACGRTARGGALISELLTCSTRRHHCVPGSDAGDAQEPVYCLEKD